MSSLEKETAPSIPVAADSAQPYETKELFATVDGHRMRYLRVGSGPPLVLLHGLLGYSFSWRYTMPALAPYATIYAVDMLGVGYSDRVPGLDCSLRASAERLLRFADAVGISEFDLLGTSHGGAVAMMAAAISAERQSRNLLRRLILVAPVNPWSRHGRHLAPLLGSPLGARFVRFAVEHMPFTHHYWLSRLYGDPRAIPPGTLEGYSAPYSIPGTLEQSLGIACRWRSSLRELEYVLPKITDYPTLLIWGDRDRAVYPGSAESLKLVFKQCELVMLKGAGHLPYEEMPNEFNHAVVEFRSRQS